MLGDVVGETDADAEAAASLGAGLPEALPWPPDAGAGLCVGAEPCDTAGNDAPEGLPEAAAAFEVEAVGVPLALAPLLPEAEADAACEEGAAAAPDGVAVDAGDRAKAAEGEAAAETAGSTDA
jgi:hypothetical protein